MPYPDRATPFMVGRQTVDSVLAFGQQGAKSLRVVPADISDRMVGAFFTKGLRTLVIAGPLRSSP